MIKIGVNFYLPLFKVGKLQEAMARATPTKATNELKEKLRREEEKVILDKVVFPHLSNFFC